MCAIAGFILPEGERSASIRLQRMTDVQAHRGPDAEGQLVLPEGRPGWVVGLGHRRLAILDLSDAGRQPMATPDRQAWIVFNGEVFNFRELRARLEQQGESFTTQSDTEVLLRLLVRDGEAGLAGCNGMWALACWDAREGSLLLARDRLGVKPLYYYHRDGVLVYGSEIKALLTAGVPRAMREQGIREYLRYGYCSDPNTMYRDIRQLEAGCCLRYRHGTIHVEPYWVLRDFVGQQREARPEHLLERFDSAVRLRMVSDVPLGAFLSGGIDSSAIVASMRATGQGEIRTFCISFPGSQVDEAVPARFMANHVRAQHTELTFAPDGIGVTRKAIHHVDEPFADDAFLPTYVMCQLARSQVTVALSGDGGDEVFAGYDKYRTQQVAQRVPPAVHGLLALAAAGAGGARRLPMPVALRDRIGWLQQMLETLGMDAPERFAAKMAILPPDLARQLSPSVNDGVDDRVLALLSEPSTGDFLDRMLYADIRFGLVNNMLRKVDRMSMAWGLEVRTPFLDYRLVEFAASLHSRQRISGLTTKYLLRQAIQHRVPHQLMNRSKQGFDVPLDRWFRGSLVSFVREVLSETGVRRHGLLSWPTIEAILTEHESGRADRSRQVFALLTFQLWHDAYIRDSAYAPPADQRLPIDR
jgi:asparagine synthase (glutamine-hydrolysing)